MILTADWEIELIAKAMKSPRPKWTRNDEGEYELLLPSGKLAWIAKAKSSKNQCPWFGRIHTPNRTDVHVKGWTLAAAKASVEARLGL